MDRSFLEHHLPVGLDMWFRDHCGDTYSSNHMTTNQREAAVKSLSAFLIPHLVNNHEQILRLHQDRIAAHRDTPEHYNSEEPKRHERQGDFRDGHMDDVK